MLFKNVIGQQQVKQQLLEMVAQNRLSHALIFLGREGSGALPLALAFASYVSLLPDRIAAAGASLFGEAIDLVLPTQTDDADAWMEKQPAYSRAAEMVHPDIHYSYPAVTRKSGSPALSSEYAAEWRDFIRQMPYGNVFDWLQFIGAENKQGNITAHECNDIIRKLNLKSFESQFKVLVMWMPEYLGKEGNKLLKLIEEPPADTLFILVAENETQILSTILSRCQLIKIPALSASEIEHHLQKKAGLTADQAKLIANTSEGSYREALHLLNHADEDFITLLREWLNVAVKNQLSQQNKIIEEISRLGREKQKQLLRQGLHLLEQAVKLEAMGETFKDLLLQSMAPVEAEFAARINKVMSMEQKQALTEVFSDATYFVERNANAKILFHALTIKIHHIVRNNIVFA